MAWIESHQSLARHRKTLRAASLLHVDRHKLIGHLHELWWWALDNAPSNGSLAGLSDCEIAAGADWPKDATAFIAALADAGFLDRDADGLRLHDWYDYAGKLNDRKQANRARMRTVRDTSRTHVAHVQSTDDARATHVRDVPSDLCRATGPNRTGPDLTGPDRLDVILQTGPEIHMPPLAQRSLSVPIDDAAEIIFGRYRERIQPRALPLPAAMARITTRRKTFTTEQLLAAVDRFAADAWQMSHNAHRGATWFFASDARIEAYVNLMTSAHHQSSAGTGAMSAESLAVLAENDELYRTLPQRAAAERERRERLEEETGLPWEEAEQQLAAKGVTTDA